VFVLPECLITTFSLLLLCHFRISISWTTNVVLGVRPQNLNLLVSVGNLFDCQFCFGNATLVIFSISVESLRVVIPAIKCMLMEVHNCSLVTA